MHKMLHLFTARWENTARLPVPGYMFLFRQECTVCGRTRVQDLLGG